MRTIEVAYGGETQSLPETLPQALIAFARKVFQEAQSVLPADWTLRLGRGEVAGQLVEPFIFLHVHGPTFNLLIPPFQKKFPGWQFTGPFPGPKQSLKIGTSNEVSEESFAGADDLELGEQLTTRSLHGTLFARLTFGQEKLVDQITLTLVNRTLDLVLQVGPGEAGFVLRYMSGREVVLGGQPLSIPGNMPLEDLFSLISRVQNIKPQNVHLAFPNGQLRRSKQDDAPVESFF